MQNYIPRFIAEKAFTNDTSGTFTASTMFIDISGFTSMTQSLMTHGKEGSEILSNIINNIFTPSIKAIYDNGGFVSTFAGDAFTAIFDTGPAEYALNAAFEINTLFVGTGKISTKFGEFELAVKIGLSHGTVEYGIIDADVQKVYYFRGEAIDNCAKSEHHADKMQIVAARKFVEKLSVQFEKQSKEEHWFILTPKDLDLSPLERKLGFEIAEEIERFFVPDVVINMIDRGEFREIVSVFIGFEESDGYAESVKQVIKNTHAYGGYFNKIDFGDKGGVMLVIFGAPKGREKLYTRASDFALSLKEMRDFKFRIGISTGIAFCGIVGSELRREYTALGNVVNLSARLMTKAESGEILNGSQFKSKLSTQYGFENKGFTEFKGFDYEIEIFSLNKKTANKQRMSYSGSFVGRKYETEMLEKLISPIFYNKFAGLIYIDGPAGIGKSRFIDNFVKSLENCSSFFLPCDEILRRSFNPFEHFFKHYFEQSTSNTKEENKLIFKKLYNELVEKTQDEQIKKELITNESVIGALIGLEWEDSVFSQLDPRSKYENSLSAVKDFFIAKSLIKPVIVILEDAHWIDSDSLNMLDFLISNIKNLPVIILALCRLNDDGTDFNMFNTEVNNIETKRMKLDAFNREMMNELIIEKSGTASIPCQTSDFIWEKSGGNPFFVEQLFLYLTENNFLDNEYNLKTVSGSIPNGISQIIIARIDRLSFKMRETVKTASVLGREFAINILERMLSSADPEENKMLKVEIAEGTNEQLWDSLSELNYIFKHALIRDTVYEIQLKDSLRKLHDLAGSIIEELYHDDITNYYEILADHYDKAENINKAIQYLKNAATQTKINFKNERSLTYLDRLLVYLKEDSQTELAMKVFRTKADIYSLIGKNDLAIQSYEDTIKLAKKIPDDIMTVYCMNEIAYILRDQGKLEESLAVLEECIIIAENAGDEDGKGRAICRKGEVFERYRKYEEAKDCFIDYFNMCLKNDNKHGMAVARIDLGIVYSNMGEYKKAEESYLESIILSEELENPHLLGYSASNIGIVYSKQGYYDKAEEYYLKGLELSEKTGDRSGFQQAIGNLGFVYLNQDNLPQALECFQKKLSICEEINDQREFASAIEFIGSVYRYMGDFNKALEYYDRAIILATDLNERSNLCLISILKANILYEINRKEESLSLVNEALSIATELSDEDAVFNAKILIHKIDNNSDGLKEMLKNEEHDERKSAIICYEIWKITKDDKYKELSIKTFNKLLEATPSHEYRKMKEEMESNYENQ